MTIKFKNRIALYNTLSVAITAALVITTIYFVTNATALSHLDKDILTEKEEVINNLDWHGDSIIINKMPEWDEAEHNKVEVNPTFLQIADMNGRVVFHSSNLPDQKFLYNRELRNESYFNGMINNQHIRLGQFAIKNNSNKVIGQLTIAISQQESYLILKNLFLILSFSFPLMLLIQLLVSRFTASKAIQPIYQLIKTASGINQSNIDTRLVLPETKDEIYQLVQTINELLSRIETVIQQQKQFTSDASHEMRTPLSAIRGTLEVLIRRQREPIVYEEKIRDVIRQTDRLDVLLDQLLQLARLDSGITMIKSEMVNLHQLVTLSHEKFGSALVQKQITINIDIPEGLGVKGDKFYLELIIDNVLSNAVKYSKEKGNIFVSWNELNGLLCIKDEGIGISEEQLPKLFNPFYRADSSRSSMIKGNGLGLSIVKKLADLQQIEISVFSEPDKGTTFTLKFTS